MAAIRLRWSPEVGLPGYGRWPRPCNRSPEAKKERME
jgi:hypothetical protein